jgi:hypothetical protein
MINCTSLSDGYHCDGTYSFRCTNGIPDIPFGHWADDNPTNCSVGCNPSSGECYWQEGAIITVLSVPIFLVLLLIGFFLSFSWKCGSREYYYGFYSWLFRNRKNTPPEVVNADTFEA